MNTIRKLAALVALSFATFSFAEPISADDLAKIAADAEKMIHAAKNFQSKTLYNFMPMQVVNTMGGPRMAENITRSSMQEMQRMGVEFERFEAGVPDEIYHSERFSYALVPTTARLKIDGQIVAGTGFLIAVKRKNGNFWKYADASGFADREALLAVFEDYPEDAPTPVTTQKI